MCKLAIIILSVCILFVLATPNENVDEVSEFFTKFEQGQYGKNIRPNYGGGPVNINITMHVRDISSISEATMDYDIDVVIRHIWNDRRLAFNETEAKTNLLIMGSEFAKKIWMPDTLFTNAKDIKSHTTTTTEPQILLRIRPNGDILYSTRFLVTASCPMDLRYFPMDSQVCKLEFGSYSHTVQYIDYHWLREKNALIINKLNLPTFELIGERRTKNFMNISTGSYAHMELELLFTRSKGFYLNQIYVPAALIVIISWVPFWLERDDSHSRVALTVTTVLTITTLITNTNESLPKISYIKAIDVYLFVCFVMVFASLLQSSLAEYWESKNRKLSKVTNKHSDSTMVTPFARKAGYIDKISRTIFPSSFLAFNVIYWAIYLNVAQYDRDQFNAI